jgi:AcrR family transcriptional regulator
MMDREMARKVKRARKPEEKEDRKKKLLSVARAELTKEFDLRGLSLNGIARKARMAKSNVYRYFETREALLLELLWEEWSLWMQVLVRRATNPRAGRLDLSGVTSFLAGSFEERPLLCALTAALPSVLEQNLGEDSVYRFKQASLGFFQEAGVKLHVICGERTSSEYARLLFDAACLMAALYPHSHPAPVVERVLRRPELAFFKRDFRADLEQALRAGLGLSIRVS